MAERQSARDDASAKGDEVRSAHRRVLQLEKDLSSLLSANAELKSHALAAGDRIARLNAQLARAQNERVSLELEMEVLQQQIRMDRRKGHVLEGIGAERQTSSNASDGQEIQGSRVSEDEKRREEFVLKTLTENFIRENIAMVK